MNIQENKTNEEIQNNKVYNVKPKAKDFVSFSVADESTNISFKGTDEKVVSEKEAKILKATGLFEVSEATAKQVVKETPKPQFSSPSETSEKN